MREEANETEVQKFIFEIYEEGQLNGPFSKSNGGANEAEVPNSFSELRLGWSVLLSVGERRLCEQSLMQACIPAVQLNFLFYNISFWLLLCLERMNLHVWQFNYSIYGCMCL